MDDDLPVQHDEDGTGGVALLRSLAAAALSGALTTVLARAVLTSVRSGPLVLDEVVALAVLAVGACAAAVLTLGLASLTVGTAGRALGRSIRLADALARRLTPVAVRRVVAAGVGVGLGLGGALTAHADETDLLWVVTETATAQTSTAAEPPVATTSVEAVPVEAVGTVEAGGPGSPAAPAAPPSDEPSGPGTSVTGVVPSVGTSAPRSATTTTTPLDATTGHEDAATAPAHATTTAADTTAAAVDTATEPGPATVVVAPGDSLWSLAAAHLGPDATDTRIAHEWPRWYEENRAVVGSDPGLIRPGQVLAVPQGGDR